MTEPTETQAQEPPRAPGVVIFCAILNFITAFFAFLLALFALIGIFFGNAMGIADKITKQLSEYPLPAVNLSSGLTFFFVLLFVLCLVMAVTSLIVGRGLLKARKWTWYVQVASSVIGLLGFPFWTVANGLILVLFFQRSVRDYFKV